MYSDLVKQLHDKGTVYSELLNRVTELNNTVILKSEKLLVMLKELQDCTVKAKPNLCSVCLINDSSHCFLPCAHGGYCYTCAMRGQRRNRCFACRAPIQSYFKDSRLY